MNHRATISANRLRLSRCRLQGARRKLRPTAPTAAGGVMSRSVWTARSSLPLSEGIRRSKSAGQPAALQRRCNPRVRIPTLKTASRKRPFTEPVAPIRGWVSTLIAGGLSQPAKLLCVPEGPMKRAHRFSVGGSPSIVTSPEGTADASSNLSRPFWTRTMVASRPDAEAVGYSRLCLRGSSPRGTSSFPYKAEPTFTWKPF